MKIVGYNRVSTREQNLDRGDREIMEFCNLRNYKLKKIFSDKTSGRNFDRPRYIVMKEDVLESGDILIIPELDRLGRNKKEILKELEFFKEHEIRVMILDIPTTLTDFSAFDSGISGLILEAINNIMIEMYALFAQAEVDKKSDRQRQGIEAMKRRGEWYRYGRPRKMELEDFKSQYQKVLRNEMKPFELMKYLNLKESTYYRYRKLIGLEEEKKKR